MVRLTPAEELGLSGLNLDSRIRKAFHAIPEAQVVELSQRMNDEGARRHLIYLREGQNEVVPVLLRPMAVMPDQRAYIHYVTVTILNALKRLPDLYIGDS